MVFLSLEDETGIANAVMPPELFEAERLTITQESVLRITGPIQSRQGLPMIRAEHVEQLACAVLEGTASHDYR